MMGHMKYEMVVVGALETNCYLVYCEDTLECAVVDPGADPEKIIYKISDLGPLCIHSSDSKMLDNILASAIGSLLGAKKSPKPDKFLEEGESVSIGNSHLKVIHTPGHSPGSISLMGDGFLLSGDLLFSGGVGRTDLPGGSWNVLEDSIRNKIFILPDETVVLPGHGPSTSIGQEKMSNMFIR